MFSSLLLPAYIHFPVWFPLGSSLSFLNPLFSLSLQSFSFALPLPALSEVLVLGEFLRGIFPALDCQYGP